MMYGPEKSDHAIVAEKPANKAEGPPAAPPAGEKHAAESVERRAGTKGNADQQSTHRTQRRYSVAQALERIRKVANTHFAVTHPRWEPDAGKPHVRICAGGARQLASLPLLGPFLRCMSLLLCRFSAAGMMAHRHAEAAGGRKAPRHE